MVYGQPGISAIIANGMAWTLNYINSQVLPHWIHRNVVYDTFPCTCNMSYCDKTGCQLRVKQKENQKDAEMVATMQILKSQQKDSEMLKSAIADHAAQQTCAMVGCKDS